MNHSLLNFPGTPAFNIVQYWSQRNWLNICTNDSATDLWKTLFFKNTMRASSCIETRGLVTRCPRPKHILPRIIRNDCDGGDTSIGTDQIGQKFSAPEVFRPKPDKLRGRGVILTSSRVVWSKKMWADFRGSIGGKKGKQVSSDLHKQPISLEGTQPPSILSSLLQNPQKPTSHQSKTNVCSTYESHHNRYHLSEAAKIQPQVSQMLPSLSPVPQVGTSWVWCGLGSLRCPDTGVLLIQLSYILKQKETPHGQTLGITWIQFLGHSKPVLTFNEPKLLINTLRLAYELHGKPPSDWLT